jgi:hypothetical protein
MLVHVPGSSMAMLIERIRATDPDVVAAADEVDGDLLDWFATLSPEERLRRASRMGAELEAMRRDLAER